MKTEEGGHQSDEELWESRDDRVSTNWRMGEPERQSAQGMNGRWQKLKNDRVSEGTCLHKGQRNDYKDLHESSGYFYSMPCTCSCTPVLVRKGSHWIPDGVAEHYHYYNVKAHQLGGIVVLLAADGNNSPYCMHATFLSLANCHPIRGSHFHTIKITYKSFLLFKQTQFNIGIVKFKKFM